MNALTHASINLFPIIMLFVIYVNNHTKAMKKSGEVQFDVLTLLGIGLMITGTLGHGLDGAPGNGINIGLWISHISYLLMVTGIASSWFVYICCRLKVWGAEAYMSRVKRYLYILNGLMALLIVTTPWTRQIFFITEDNHYQEGDCYYLVYLVSVLLLLASIAVVLQVYGQEISAEQRVECQYLLWCGIPPLVGFALQYFLYDVWISTSCLALTILFIYLNAQNRQITIDKLTGLNNRGEFDQQLKKRAEQISDSNWGMLMLDVNDFKKINDSFGHIVGDDALWETADILRRALGKSKLLLARYGGDEFAVIGEWRDEEGACAAITAVENEVEAFNKEAGKEYKLSFSMGYAMWSEVDTIEQLIKKADERMYLVKARKKREAAMRAT